MRVLLEPRGEGVAASHGIVQGLEDLFQRAFCLLQQNIDRFVDWQSREEQDREVFCEQKFLCL